MALVGSEERARARRRQGLAAKMPPALRSVECRLADHERGYDRCRCNCQPSVDEGRERPSPTGPARRHGAAEGLIGRAQPGARAERGDKHHSRVTRYVTHSGASWKEPGSRMVLWATRAKVADGARIERAHPCGLGALPTRCIASLPTVLIRRDMADGDGFEPPRPCGRHRASNASHCHSGNHPLSSHGARSPWVAGGRRGIRTPTSGCPLQAVFETAAATQQSFGLAFLVPRAGFEPATSAF